MSSEDTLKSRFCGRCTRPRAARGPLPRARHQRSDVLCVEKEVSGLGTELAARAQAAARGRTSMLKRLVADLSARSLPTAGKPRRLRRLRRMVCERVSVSNLRFHTDGKTGTRPCQNNFSTAGRSGFAGRITIGGKEVRDDSLIG